jgi:hypothetical protein
VGQIQTWPRAPTIPYYIMLRVEAIVLGHRGKTRGYEEEAFSRSRLWRRIYKWAQGERKKFKQRYWRRMRRKGVADLKKEIDS